MTKPWWTRLLLGRTAVSNPLRSAALDEAPDAQFEAQWRGLVKKRMVPLLVVLAVWVVAIEGRLFWIQVVQHDKWTANAVKQQENNTAIYLPRGDVLDRNGRVLAYSITSYDVHLDPKKAVEIGKFELADFAHEICVALTDCNNREEAAIAARLAQKNARDVVIRRARDMSFDAAAGMEAFFTNLDKNKRRPKDYIDLRSRDVRYYPKMGLAAQVIGYVKTEDDTTKGSKAAVVSGLNGVEKQFDDDLRGKPGIELRQIDGLRNDITTTVISPPKSGVTLELTLDTSLQEIAESSLASGIERAGARSGTALVLDSATGEVLAMANYPSFNLNLPGDAQGAELNHATMDLNEPGSTFKMVTLSAALDEGVVVPTTTFNTNGKFFVEGRRTPITEDKGHNYGPLTVEGILVHSSNIGAAMIGLQMGSDRMLRYAEMFGFTKSMASRDFYSEHLGIINAPKGVLTKASLATVAYGYGVVASPLQLATAMNVFATGGLLLRPHLVRAVIENGVRRTQEPEVVRRVISEETAATMTTMLEAVVETGTGTPAKLDRYRVAGKTGTTKKVMAGGGYSENDYRVSFVGFAPSRHPRFTIIVVIDEPTKLPAYGGAVSAPVFKEIAERSLNYVGETPSVNPPPAVIVAESRTPSARPSRPEPPPVFVNAVGVPTMPDLTGLTLRDALQRLPPGFTVTAQGDGVVVWQSLGAGEAIATDRFVLRLQSVPAKTGGASR